MKVNDIKRFEKIFEDLVIQVAFITKSSVENYKDNKIEIRKARII